MADYVEFTDAETAAKAFLRQAFFRKMKDDFINHQDRLGTLETSVKMFDHFITTTINESTPYAATQSFENLRAVVTGQVGLGSRWYFCSDLASPQGARNGAKPAFSVARIVIPTTAGTFANIQSLMQLRYDKLTKPLTYEARLKLSADIVIQFGLLNSYDFQTGLGFATRGIGLERVDASNWRFTTNNGVKTNGTAFAKPAVGSWFKVKIVLTNTPSDRALCYVDDVLKETFTTQVPTDQDLDAIVQGVTNAGTGANLDIDRVEWGATGALDAP